MADLKNKVNSSLFSNALDLISVEYDYSKDGGAIGVLDMIEMKHAVVIHRAWVKVSDSVLSGGAATVEIGVKGGDTDAVLAASAPAALVAPSVTDGDAASKALYLASGAILSMEIKVAALTAGKVELIILAEKF